jgi:pimeloyl-ACP methyl ester carboxylesterase
MRSRGPDSGVWSVSVLENRAQSKGRNLDLHVAVIRHAAGQRSKDAIFVLGGGPGQGSTVMVEYVTERYFKGVGRDLVFVDARGTGQSNPLNCDFGGGDEDLQGYMKDFLPLVRAVSMRQESATKSTCDPVHSDRA